MAGAAAGMAVGKRGAPRARVQLPALMDALSGTQQVLLENVSETGARVITPLPPKLGAEVILRCGMLDVFAIVAWSRPGCCGLQFDERTDIKQVLALKAEGDRLAGSRYSIAQMRAAEDWQHGCIR